MSLNSVVRGHGEVILRGEVQDLIHSDLTYLENIRQATHEVVDHGDSIATLDSISIESCGKSRIPLNGFVTDLHQANLRKLYHDLSQEMAPRREIQAV
jgi:hypothetical protein